MKLSIIVPFYNESSRLPGSIGQILQYLENQTHDWELILVDDGSQDNSKEYLSEFLKDTRIKLLIHEKNSGKGFAVRTGVLSSYGDIILFSDADLSTPINELEKLLDAINSGYKIAIGSRDISGSHITKKQPLLRRLLGKSARVMIRGVLQMPYLDTQCGFKMFESSVAKKYFESMKTKRWSFDYEILYRAKKDGIIAKEVPVYWHDDTKSKINILNDYINCFIDLIKIRLQK